MPLPRHNRKSMPLARAEWMPLAVIAALSLLACGLWLVRGRRVESPTSSAASAPSAPVVPPPVAAPPMPLPAPMHAEELRGATAGPTGNLVVARSPQPQPTSLNGDLQRSVTAMLAKAGVPYSAVVMIDPHTGQVLTLAESRDASDRVGDIGSLTKPTVPAASVIKVVTSAALLEAGATPDSEACFHGGFHGLDASHVAQKPSDRRCETLTLALARSSNAAFARFALRDLQPGQLKAMAERFGFNCGVPSDIAMESSRFDDAGDALARAKAAAGFAGSTLSPLHAAWLAAVVASDGKLKRIAAWDPAVQVLVDSPQRSPLPQAIAERTAAALRMMMVQTTEVGTGRHGFSHRPKALQGMAVGGKTGSLSASEGELFRHVSWFVGFAPAERPRVAIAALAVNGSKWKVKAPALARDALGLFFEHAGQKTADAAGFGLDEVGAAL